MVAINASTPYLGGNPYAFTSGWVQPNQIIVGKHKIQRLYWVQPTLESSSSLIITKRNATSATLNGGMVYANLKAEVSGQSQQLNLGDQWWDNFVVACVPTGTLYIYLDD